MADRSLLKKWIASLLLFGGSLFLYSPVRSFEFVKYDDPLYVTANPRLQLGFGWQNLKWAFSSTESSNWHPLTWLSHLADYQFFALNPAGHHLTNAMLHSVNTFLLFWLLATSTAAFWPSVLAAGLFAFHPINVESVAWVAERKNVLSTFFWLATIGMYFSHIRTPKRTTYVAMLVCFALGLMSKSMVVTLPAIMLVLDFWPLGRLDKSGPSNPRSRKDLKSRQTQSHRQRPSTSGFIPLVREKIPLLMLSALVSGIAILAQRQTGDLQSLLSLPLSSRLENAAVSAVRYLEKLAWPTHLAVMYPYSSATIPLWHVLGSCLLLIGVTWGVLRQFRRRPYLAAGWLWFVISSLPIIGIIQVGAQSMADRYAYVPFIGLFIMIAWSLDAFISRFRNQRNWVYAAMLLPLLPCWGMARQQLAYWQTNDKLFRHALEVTSQNYIAYQNLATRLLEEGRVDEGMAYIKKSLEANPGQDAIQRYHRGDALVGLGGAYMLKGDPRTAELWLRQGLDLVPQSAWGYNSLGRSLSLQGKNAEALLAYARAAALKPALDLLPEIHFNWGNALAAIGRAEDAKIQYGEAIQAYKVLLEWWPSNSQAHVNLGALLYLRGDLSEAAEHYLKAISIKPQASAYFLLGIVFSDQGRYQEAIRSFQSALKLDPQHAKAKARLAQCEARVNEHAGGA